jgi:hypothetical protein
VCSVSLDTLPKSALPLAGMSRQGGILRNWTRANGADEHERGEQAANLQRLEETARECQAKSKQRAHPNGKAATHRSRWWFPYLVDPKEAGRMKTILTRKLLVELNKAPDKVLFPKSNMRQPILDFRFWIEVKSFRLAALRQARAVQARPRPRFAAPGFAR